MSEQYFLIGAADKAIFLALTTPERLQEGGLRSAEQAMGDV